MTAGSRKISVYFEIFCATRKRTKISVSKLSKSLNMSGTTVRRVVRELVKCGVPIASDRNGFWVMLSKKEMQQYLNRLQKVQVAISERIADAYHAFELVHKK